GGVARYQLLERGQRALARFLVAEEPAMVMAGEHDAEHFEGDLLGVGVATQVAFFDGEAYGLLRDGVAAMLVGDDGVADRSRTIVVFVGGGDHDAAAGQAGRNRP